jgi:hypothetical protein
MGQLDKFVRMDIARESRGRLSFGALKKPDWES